jgi:hypothetical protein|tara:strand:+ start:445 stop:573 length:129 start_codon:yes stop_codon:yes gene_type:complete
VILTVSGVKIHCPELEIAGLLGLAAAAVVKILIPTATKYAIA